jgi:uncharacterized protein (TIGR00251 family)
VAWFRATAGGLTLVVRLTPRGGRDAIEGPLALSDGSEVLAVRVRALPEDGAANAALVALIATTFGVARSAVAVVSGATSRVKQIRISGEPAALAARVQSVLRRPG